MFFDEFLKCNLWTWMNSQKDRNTTEGKDECRTRKIDSIRISLNYSRYRDVLQSCNQSILPLRSLLHLSGTWERMEDRVNSLFTLLEVFLRFHRSSIGVTKRHVNPPWCSRPAGPSQTLCMSYSFFPKHNHNKYIRIYAYLNAKLQEY